MGAIDRSFVNLRIQPSCTGVTRLLLENHFLDSSFIFLMSFPELFSIHFLKSFYGPFILSIIGQYTLCLLNNNSFSLSFFFLSSLSFLWIGAQFPQEKFLSYARILTLYYYFLLMCI